MGERHANYGKWSESGVPHRGWSCVGYDDLEEPSQVCEMCENADVRYVHYMQHPDYHEILAVGCVCAENMESDYVGPRQREKRMRSIARRRRTWGKRSWRMSAKGNIYLNAEGYNLVVAHTGAGFRVIVSNRETYREQRGHKIFATEKDAKDAALAALLWAKDHI